MVLYSTVAEFTICCVTRNGGTKHGLEEQRIWQKIDLDTTDPPFFVVVESRPLAGLCCLISTGALVLLYTYI
jgi:hypothetical protein